MYLPGWALRAILVRSGCWKEGDRLYVSCEAGKTKHSAEMFRHVLESESILASQMVHVGNHPYSDVEVPRRLGIGVEPFLQGNLNARESGLSTVKGFGRVLPGLLTGCSRLARLRATERTAQHQRIREIAAHTAWSILKWIRPLGFTDRKSERYKASLFCRKRRLYLAEGGQGIDRVCRPNHRTSLPLW